MNILRIDFWEWPQKIEIEYLKIMLISFTKISHPYAEFHDNSPTLQKFAKQLLMHMQHWLMPYHQKRTEEYMRTYHIWLFGALIILHLKNLNSKIYIIISELHIITPKVSF